MNKKLKNSIIITLIALPCIVLGGCVLNMRNDIDSEGMESNEVLPGAEISGDIESEINDGNLSDNGSIEEGENEEDKLVDEERNEVLENYEGTQAPMPIPIPDYDAVDQILMPFYHEDTGLLGYKCQNNEIAIKPQFTGAGMFYSELAPVQLKKNGKIGFINMKGEVVKKPFIDYICEVNTDKGVMIVQVSDKYGALSLEGDIILDIEYSSEEEVAEKVY